MKKEVSPIPWRVERTPRCRESWIVSCESNNVIGVVYSLDDAAIICDAVNLKARIDKAMKDEDGFNHPVMLDGRPCVFVTPPPSEAESERMSREVISGLASDRMRLYRQLHAAFEELDRLRDIVRRFADGVRNYRFAAGPETNALLREAREAIGDGMKDGAR